MNLPEAVRAFEAEFLEVYDGPPSYMAPDRVPYDTVAIAATTQAEAAEGWLAAARRAAGPYRQLLWWRSKPELTGPHKREAQPFRVYSRFRASNRAS